MSLLTQLGRKFRRAGGDVAVNRAAEGDWVYTGQLEVDDIPFILERDPRETGQIRSLRARAAEVAGSRTRFE